MATSVVVTGAAGALGRAVMSDLRSRGVKTVVALDRPSAALDEVGRSKGVHAIAVDLADRDAVRAAWEQIDEIDEVATPDALVALAGGFVPGSLADLDETTLDGLWHTNVGSLLWCAQAAASRMASSGGGSIVTVGSKTAVSGAAPVGHAATKAAVVRVTELLAEELRGSGIRANAVLPSVIDTPANRTWMSESLAARAVPPAAIAKVIAFLVSDDAWPISGAAIPVYGDA
ncbi:SDR family NAD(P)-dependent oxidoreductase [Pseudonocardia sp. H11422]|uniref:SDR family NAD(P)-dependent oxidoreductase n=1 Tax=Pseudonocardia sp. H11422 TaxID=2835866 RepID=UPI001BDC41F6|nr:SDR family NAD(P)-dependent oxidoreductase [Pseudonocardia sp. H11422]